MKKRVISLLLAVCLFVGLLASCEAKTYTVTFETNGGTTVNALSLTEGEPLPMPSVPTKEGYTFDGWYADAAFAEAYVFGKMPAKDITLYAKWKTPDDAKKPDTSKQPLLGDRGEDGSWNSVDFKGQEVRVAISVDADEDAIFPAADIYTMGPDVAGANAVSKEVLARNARAKEALGITVTYIPKDLSCDKIHEDIRTIVQTSARNSPDIYNNDMYGLARAMVDGLLWNVKNPGKDVKSYIDLGAEGWYADFTKGMTFDQNKLYLFAGDYFIDVLRMAWVVYVNNDILTANLEKMPGWCKSIDDFYENVEYGFWDLDALADVAERVFVDSGASGVTEKTDTTVGFAMNEATARIISAASGVTLYYQDEGAGLVPKTLASADTLQQVSNKYKAMTETKGVYYEEDVKSSTTCFLQGNFLFAMGRIGDMESGAMRDFMPSRGIVPVPKWNANEQEDYRTVVDERAEVGCILNTAGAYSAASAFLQFLNEESGNVIYTYYEKALKYKYIDDQNARTMMDLVRESIASPFGFCIGNLCETLYTGMGSLKGLRIEDNATLSSTFASEKDAYKDCLDQMIAKFATFS